ncbi:MAG: hypothetical protein COV67_12200, partial [Nitrospinae bacterium CG11_big_fil_rev_8_21_14_0_20_56_8]
MDSKNFTPNILIVPTVGVVLPILGSVVSIAYFPNWRLIQEPLHSVMEALGGFIALALSGILLTLKLRQPEKTYHSWMACALIGMGILDVFHAAVMPGNVFVWLHSLAQFTGGFFFALVWLPKKISDSPLTRDLPLPLLFGTAILGIVSIHFPDLVPEMVVRGQFSPLAKAINILGGCGFLISAGFFVVRYHTYRAWTDYLFTIHCSLFGAAGVLFEFSQLWDAPWWCWHLFRLMAYSVGLVLVVSSYLATEKDLRESEARLRSIVDNSPSIIYLKDTQSRFLLINKQFNRLFNVSNEDIKGKTPLDIFPEEVGTQHIDNDRKAIQAGHPLESEEHAPHEDGLHTYLSVKFPIKNG